MAARPSSAQIVLFEHLSVGKPQHTGLLCPSQRAWQMRSWNFQWKEQCLIVPASATKLTDPAALPATGDGLGFADIIMPNCHPSGCLETSVMRNSIAHPPYSTLSNRTCRGHQSLPSPAAFQLSPQGRMLQCSKRGAAASCECRHRNGWPSRA